ncbi:MAG TPA: hypothetical protein VKV79_03160 [Terriglobia bacterium]|nr:hypothetical protein [Terriglobia bacterium]
MEITINLPKPHIFQRRILESPKKRIIVRAGRRGGKTVTAAMLAVRYFVEDRRVLYAAPVEDQTQTFWREVCRYLAPAVQPRGPIKKSESDLRLEIPSHPARIEAVSAFNGDMLRGRWADLVILDEFQLQAESVWSEVCAPMLADRNGNALFIYTPISLHSRTRSRAEDPQHAAKMFSQAEKDSRWLSLHWTSHQNPFISQSALKELSGDMTALSFRQEILAEDVNEIPGALWTRKLLDETRVTEAPELRRVVIGVDPSGSARDSANEAGIVVCGLGLDDHVYILEDRSVLASPDVWARQAVFAYEKWRADRIVGERNFGGDLVQTVIKAVGGEVSYADVTATRSKIVRAEPVAALFEQHKAHLVGQMPELEDELCSFCAGSTKSPNRLDATVWAVTELSFGARFGILDWFERESKKAESEAKRAEPALATVSDRQAMTRRIFERAMGHRLM